jgi:hypothetical protein
MAQKDKGEIPPEERGSKGLEGYPLTDGPPPNSAKPPPTNTEAPSNRRMRRWLTRTLAITLPLIIGWAVTYFAPGIWASLTGLAGKRPVQVQVLVKPDDFTSGVPWVPTYVIPRSLTRGELPVSGDDRGNLYEWANQMAGTNATDTLVRLVIRGDSASPVILQNLDVEVVNRQPALAGTFIGQDGLGSGVTVRYVSADLDSTPPDVRFVNPAGETLDVLPLQVTPSDVEVIDIYAFSLECDCEWVVNLVFAVDGETESMTVDDDGKPFRTTSDTAATPRWIWNGNKWMRQ